MTSYKTIRDPTPKVEVQAHTLRQMTPEQTAAVGLKRRHLFESDDDEVNVFSSR